MASYYGNRILGLLLLDYDVRDRDASKQMRSPATLTLELGLRAIRVLVQSVVQIKSDISGFCLSVRDIYTY